MFSVPNMKDNVQPVPNYPLHTVRYVCTWGLFQAQQAPCIPLQQTK
jgi:hypothetical protein